MIQSEQGRCVDPFEVWRRSYQLAPTDPRFLDVDEETVLSDLVQRRLIAEELRSEFDPDGAMADRLAADEGEQGAIIERADGFLESNKEAIGRLLDPGDGRPKIRRIQIGPVSMDIA